MAPHGREPQFTGNKEEKRHKGIRSVLCRYRYRQGDDGARLSGKEGQDEILMEGQGWGCSLTDVFSVF